jgi:hypothetical protein
MFAVQIRFIKITGGSVAITIASKDFEIPQYRPLVFIVVIKLN